MNRCVKVKRIASSENVNNYLTFKYPLITIGGKHYKKFGARKIKDIWEGEEFYIQSPAHKELIEDLKESGEFEIEEDQLYKYIPDYKRTYPWRLV